MSLLTELMMITRQIRMPCVLRRCFKQNVLWSLTSQLARRTFVTKRCGRWVGLRGSSDLMWFGDTHKAFTLLLQMPRCYKPPTQSHSTKWQQFECIRIRPLDVSVPALLCCWLPLQIPKGWDSFSLYTVQCREMRKSTTTNSLTRIQPLRFTFMSSVVASQVDSVKIKTWGHFLAHHNHRRRRFSSFPIFISKRISFKVVETLCDSREVGGELTRCMLLFGCWHGTES